MFFFFFVFCCPYLHFFLPCGWHLELNLFGFSALVQVFLIFPWVGTGHPALLL